MNRRVLNVFLALALAWLCGLSVKAGEANAPPIRPRYAAALPEAVAHWQSVGVIDGEGLEAARPSAVISVAQIAAMVYRWKGKPEEVPAMQPFDPVLLDPAAYYYKGICLLAQMDLLDEIGWDCNVIPANITREMVDKFLQKTVSNAEIAALVYGFERVRLAREPELSEELLAVPPYPDIALKDPYLKAVVWAKQNKLVTGILDASAGDAVTFNPEKPEIGNGICTRGQFFIVLYVYTRFVKAAEEQQAAEAQQAAA